MGKISGFQIVIEEALRYDGISIGLFAPTYKQAFEFVNYINKNIVDVLIKHKLVKSLRSSNSLLFNNGSRITYLGLGGHKYEAIMGCNFPLVYLIDLYGLSKEAKLWSVLRNRVGALKDKYPNFKPKIYKLDEDGVVELDKETLIDNKL